MQEMQPRLSLDLTPLIQLPWASSSSCRAPFSASPQILGSRYCSSSTGRFRLNSLPPDLEIPGERIWQASLSKANTSTGEAELCHRGWGDNSPNNRPVRERSLKKWSYYICTVVQLKRSKGQVSSLWTVNSAGCPFIPENFIYIY